MDLPSRSRRAGPAGVALTLIATAALGATRAAADEAATMPPAPVDIAAFPPPAAPPPRDVGIEVHGVVAPWWTPWSQPGPGAATDAVRLRFAVLRVDARPAPRVTVLARLGLMLPGSPLLDAQATYQPGDAVGVTFGQFRLPIGASATTLAPQLTMLDRPRYVYAMTKQAFRDVGAMIHTGPGGLADGLVHARVAVAGGSGRLGNGVARAPAAGQYLVAARVVVDAGRRVFGGARDRLAVGASYLRSHDPAIDTGTAAADATLAAGTLGTTLAPIGVERVTSLVGADATLARGAAWAQAEVMYLRSRGVDDPAQRDAAGVSVEVAWTLPVRLGDHALQVAARGERFDPDLDAAGDAQHVAAVGVNASLARLRWSAFGSVTFFDDAATGASRHAGALALRAVATF